MLAIVHAEEDWRAGGCACKTRVQPGKIAVVNIFACFRKLQRGRISECNTVEVKVGAGYGSSGSSLRFVDIHEGSGCPEGGKFYSQGWT